MFEFLFGRSKKDIKPKRIAEPVSDQAKKNDIRLEMIRLALKSVLRRYGIPLHWIGCEIEPMPGSDDADKTLIQLVILQWHDALMRYAPELQNQLLNEIQFFDTTADATSFLIVWKFAPDCGYPADQVPGADFWAPAADSTPPDQTQRARPVAAAAVSVATAVPAAKFDLPKSKFDEEDGDDGFPATQLFEEK